MGRKLCYWLTAPIEYWLNSHQNKYWSWELMHCLTAGLPGWICSWDTHFLANALTWSWRRTSLADGGPTDRKQPHRFPFRLAFLTSVSPAHSPLPSRDYSPLVQCCPEEPCQVGKGTQRRESCSALSFKLHLFIYLGWDGGHMPQGPCRS